MKKVTNNSEAFIKALNLNETDSATIHYALNVNKDAISDYISELNDSYEVFLDFMRTKLNEKAQSIISKHINVSKPDEQVFKEKIDYTKSKNKWQTEILNKIVMSAVKGDYDTADSLLNWVNASHDTKKRTTLRRELGKFLKDAGVKKTKIYDKDSKSMITIYFLTP